MKKPDISRFDKISESARTRVYSEVLKHFKKHPDSPWSGRGLVELEKTLKAFYASMGEEYRAVFRDTIPETMKRFYDDAVREIRTAGLYKAVVGSPDPKRIKYFLDSSYQQVAMKTDKMLFDHVRELRKLSADVFREVSITGATRREVSKRLLERAMNIKGFEFIDKSGTKWPLKSYFDTLARTELMNAGRASYDDKMADEGFDVMKLTTSGMSCAKCAAFEGRLFSLTGAAPNLPSKADLEAAGVFHPNCTHSYSLMPDFIRERDYNADGTKKTDAEKTQTAQPQEEKALHEFYDYSKASPQELEKLSHQYEERILATCTNGERMAISNYSMNDYFPINGHYRNTLELQAKDKAIVIDMADKISSALDKVRCMDYIKVFRGTNSGESVFPGMKTGKTLEDCVKELVASREPVVLNGFTSTSVLRKQAEDFSAGVQFEINVPKGARAAFIKSESQVKEEMEMLLDRETKVRIIGYREDFNKEKSRLIKVVTMEVI